MASQAELGGGRGAGAKKSGYSPRSTRASSREKIVAEPHAASQNAATSVDSNAWGAVLPWQQKCIWRTATLGAGPQHPHFHGGPTPDVDMTVATLRLHQRRPTFRPEPSQLRAETHRLTAHPRVAGDSPPPPSRPSTTSAEWRSSPGSSCVAAEHW